MEKYFNMLYREGVNKAVRISADSIVTAPWSSYKCRYGCDFYGKNLCCPPNTPSWKETREMIACYEYGILFNAKDSSAVAITPLAVHLAREAFLDGYYKAVAFGSGPCLKCRECSMTHCRFPKETVPSMEGCGIDVFATVRNNGFEIDTVRNKNAEHDYFGLVLFE